MQGFDFWWHEYGSMRSVAATLGTGLLFSASVASFGMAVTILLGSNRWSSQAVVMISAPAVFISGGIWPMTNVLSEPVFALGLYGVLAPVAAVHEMERRREIEERLNAEDSPIGKDGRLGLLRQQHMQFIDSHSHLNSDAFDEDRDEVIARIGESVRAASQAAPCTSRSRAPSRPRRRTPGAHRSLRALRQDRPALRLGLLRQQHMQFIDSHSHLNSDAGGARDGAPSRDRRASECRGFPNREGWTR